MSITRMRLGWFAAILMVCPAVAQEAKPAASGQKADAKAQPAELTCPVSGEPIQKNAFTYFKNRRVYFCCKNCLGKFEKDPGKYSDGVTKQWEANKLLRVQVLCPVTGKVVDRKVYVEGDDDRIYFADEDAKKKWNGADQGMRNRLEEQCFTYQPLCPIGGEMVDPASSAEIDGKKVYFCCDGCIEKFKKNQAENMKKLDETIKANKGAYTRKVLAEKLGAGRNGNGDKK